jgi:hypothetical protein
MNGESMLEPRIRFSLALPNGTEANVLISPRELKRILVTLGERDYLPSADVAMLLVGLGLEEQ